MAGMASRTGACNEECSARLPNTDISGEESEEMGRASEETVDSARTLTNHKLYFRSVDGTQHLLLCSSSNERYLHQVTSFKFFVYEDMNTCLPEKQHKGHKAYADLIDRTRLD